MRTSWQAHAKPMLTPQKEATLFLAQGLLYRTYKGVGVPVLQAVAQKNMAMHSRRLMAIIR